MKRNLISEWSAGEHWGKLFMVESPDTYGGPQSRLEDNIYIALELGCNSHKGCINFLWMENEDFIQGITEILITTCDQLTRDLVIGILSSKAGTVFFGWSPFTPPGDCGLMLCQGDEKVLVQQAHAVDFFRWLRNSLQLMGRIVS